MAGPDPPKSSSSAATHRKSSRWESSSGAPKNRNPPADAKPSSKPKPSPKSGPSPSPAQKNTQSGPKPTPPRSSAFPCPDPAALGPPPPPAYGFHMLERRTIVLFDGSVRSYFALPPDYQDFPVRPLGPPEFSSPPLGPGLGFRENPNYWNHDGSLKRKHGEDGKKGPGGYIGGPSGPGASGQEMRAAKYMRVGNGGYENNLMGYGRHLEVDQDALKKAFLHFVKVIFEQKKNYLEDGKQGRFRCVACSRSSKDFPDMHGLIMHTYYSDKADLLVDHLGLHKALCVLMGWNYSKPPDNSKAYQFLPADVAAANQEDLIMWPPMVIIHNTITGKGKDGRMEGLGNKAMDSKIRDLGFGSGKSKSLYGRDGHLGVTLIKFMADQRGLKDAIRLAEHFERENHGCKSWHSMQPVTLGKDDEKNPNLVRVDGRTGEKKRIFYGYLAIAADLDRVDFDTRKKVVIESRREYKGP